MLCHSIDILFGKPANNSQGFLESSSQKRPCLPGSVKRLEERKRRPSNQPSANYMSEVSDSWRERPNKKDLGATTEQAGRNFCASKELRKSSLAKGREDTSGKQNQQLLASPASLTVKFLRALRPSPRKQKACGIFLALRLQAAANNESTPTGHCLRPCSQPAFK